MQQHRQAELGCQRQLGGIEAFLALARQDGVKCSRDAVVGRLWADSSVEHANGSLRTALWRIRSAWAGLVDSAAAGLDLPREAAVCLVGLGEERVDNLSIDDVRAERDQVSGQGTSLEIVLSNHTDRDQTGVPVTAYVGETRVGEAL